MTSTYSDRLKLELMATGANANTWGNNTNTNLETLDAFSAGYLSKSVAGSANVTLTTNNADPTAEASNKVLELTGTLTGNIHVFLPAVEGNYIIFNNTSGSFTLDVAPTGHGANSAQIVQGAHSIIYNTGTKVVDMFAGSLGNLSLVSGGVFTGNAAGASAINASNVASGTIPDARLTANVTLNNASTISTGTLPTAQVPDLAASKITSGTLSNDRLDTIPTSKGGTGLASVGSTDQVLTVTGPGALAWADAAGGVVGNVTGTQQLTGPGSFSSRSDAMFGVTFGLGGGGSGGCGGHGFGQGQGQPGGNTPFSGLGSGNGGPQGAAGFPPGGANATPGGAGTGGFGEGGPASQGGNQTGSGGAGAVSPYSPYGNGGRGAGPAGGEEGSGGGAGGVYKDIVGPYTKGSPISVTVGTGGTGRPGNRGTGQAGNAGKAQFTEYYA